MHRIFDRRRLLAAGIFSLTGRRLGFAGPQRFKSVPELREAVMVKLKKLSRVSKIRAHKVDPAQFEYRLGGLNLLADVTNLFDYLIAYPDEDTGRAVDQFIRGLLEAGNQPKATDENIIAVIRTRSYIEDMKARGTDIMSEPFIDDLMIVYMIDSPDALTSLTPEEAPGKSLSQLHEIAFRNVRRWLPKLVREGSADSGILYHIEGNPSVTSALLLMNEFWAQVGAHFSGNVLIAIPRRDQVFLFDADAAQAASIARRLVDATIEDKYILLSPRLYIRRNNRIDLFIE